VDVKSLKTTSGGINTMNIADYAITQMDLLVIIIVEIVVLIHVFLWWHEKKEGGKE
jgi:hypothetical protein